MILWYLSDLAKVGMESGVWIDEYNYQQKKNITKSMSVIFSVQCSKNHVIPHSVIAAILDNSKRRKQQYVSQVLQIQPLLKTIGK